MGAEKWLDIELWNSAAECFHALKKRGYRIASTCLGTDSVFSHYHFIFLMLLQYWIHLKKNFKPHRLHAFHLN
jgi:hypothetical protein